MAPARAFHLSRFTVPIFFNRLRWKRRELARVRQKAQPPFPVRCLHPLFLSLFLVCRRRHSPSPPPQPPHSPRANCRALARACHVDRFYCAEIKKVLPPHSPLPRFLLPAARVSPAAAPSLLAAASAPPAHPITSDAGHWRRRPPETLFFPKPSVFVFQPATMVVAEDGSKGMASRSSPHSFVRGRRCSSAFIPTLAAVVVHGAVTVFLGRTNMPDAAPPLPSSAGSPSSSQLSHRWRHALP
jgi:hypothetical protein